MSNLTDLAFVRMIIDELSEFDLSKEKMIEILRLAIQKLEQ